MPDCSDGNPLGDPSRPGLIRTHGRRSENESGGLSGSEVRVRRLRFGRVGVLAGTATGCPRGEGDGGADRGSGRLSFRVLSSLAAVKSAAAVG